MLVFESPSALAKHAGAELGVSEWTPVPQSLIDRFAQVTGDLTWIHTDPLRAAREMPGGTTIAHGYLTLALAPSLMAQIYRIEKLGQVLNYGVDRLRFVTPVPRGGRIRLRLALKQVEPRSDGGYRFTFLSTIELEHAEKPAAAYEMLVLMYPEGS